MNATGERITILLADDDPDDRQLTKEAFAECHLVNKVDFVEDGEQLMDYLLRRGSYASMKPEPLPGLILLDLNMPRKDGREALKEIKANPDLRRIPIVVLTTSKAEEDILRTYDLGVNSYVTKPVTFQSLVDTIKVLGKYWFEIVELPAAGLMNARPIKVLLVDDDEDDFILTREFFSEIKKQRYEIEWAPSYDKALEIITSREHDVYLFDYRLGAYSGLDLLKETQSRGIRVPVILLTGQTEGDVDVEAMHAGAEDFLVKAQLNSTSLERAIRYAIERKGAEKEIQKLAAFPRWNPNPVFEFASDGSLTYSNDAAQTLALSLKKRSPAEILPDDVRKIVTKCLAMDGPKANLQTAIGDRTFAWSFIPIHASKVVHCYATEISERLNLEAQLRHSVKMEAVGQLAAGVAHDFNNILTVIQGHADLLLHKINSDPNSEKPLKQICLASERAGNLIRQLLMFSRKQVMQHRYLDLKEVITNLMQMLQRFLGEHISLQIHHAPELPAVYGDTGMIEQVLMNLSVNARDAMPQGGQLLIRTSVVQLADTAVLRNRNSSARSGKFVCLSVADTGCGMDEKTIHRIFEPFFTTKEVGKGTGLGLATVYGIVEQHQGWVEVESRIGFGSNFKIFLPACGKPPNQKVAVPSQLSAQGGEETILVVEDEPALRMLVVEILQLYGYQVLQAQSGAAALEVWKEHQGRIDLLLTDMVMPDGISGRELGERLHKDKPTLKIIYTSGYSPGMAGKDTALLTGFNFLPKPYPPSRLAEVVRICLNKDDVKSSSKP